MYKSKINLLIIVLICSVVSMPFAVSEESEASADWLQLDRGVKAVDEGKTPGLGGRILRWPMNRALDFLDIFTFNFGFGFGLHANVHGTRALQLGAGAATQTKFGTDGRLAGFFNEARSEISVLTFSMEHYKRTNGLGFFQDISTAKARDRLYLDIRDYTGIGGAVTLAIVGVEAEFRVKEAVDFVLGVFGVDFKKDDHPRMIRRPNFMKFQTGSRNLVEKMVIVTSHVEQSPLLRAESKEGLTIYDTRGKRGYFFGEIGAWGGKDADVRQTKNFQQYFKVREFPVLDDIALRVAKVLHERSRMKIVLPTEFTKYEDQKVIKHVDKEIVRRLPNYKGLAEEYGADAVCDIRMLEWSLYRDSIGGLRARLHVECKIIKFPENTLLADISAIVYDRNKQGNSLLDFARDEGQLVVFETEQAIERLVAELGDRILEW